LRPVVPLNRQPELPHSPLHIYDIVYEKRFPTIPPPLKPLEKVEEPPTPTYQFPNVRRMAEQYSRQHERPEVPVISIPRIHRLWPDRELERIRYMPSKVVPLRIIPEKPSKI
jgi:hypothetical protein